MSDQADTRDKNVHFLIVIMIRLKMCRAVSDRDCKRCLFSWFSACRLSCVGWSRLAIRVASTTKVCRKSCFTSDSRWWRPTNCVSWRSQRSSRNSPRCSQCTYIAPTSTTRCRWRHALACVSSPDRRFCCETTPRLAGTRDSSSTTTPAIHAAQRQRTPLPVVVCVK